MGCGDCEDREGQGKVWQRDQTRRLQGLNSFSRIAYSRGTVAGDATVPLFDKTAETYALLEAMALSSSILSGFPSTSMLIPAGSRSSGPGLNRNFCPGFQMAMMISPVRWGIPASLIMRSEISESVSTVTSPSSSNSSSKCVTISKKETTWGLSMR